MKNKKVLISIIFSVVFVALVVVFLTVFTVKECKVCFHDLKNYSGDEIPTPADAPSANQVISPFVGKNLFFLSKKEIIEDVSDRFPRYHVIDVVRNFPNSVDVHFVEREVVYGISYYVEGTQKTVYLDNFGFVIEREPLHEVIDLTYTFRQSQILYDVPNRKLTFENQVDNDKFDLAIKSVNAMWQLYYDYDEVAQVINEITFSANISTMTVETKNGVKIVVNEPNGFSDEEFGTKLHEAFSIYFNSYKHLTGNVVINVPVTGSITTINE